MDSKAPKMNKQSTSGKRKHGTLIPQKIEIIRRFESSENWKEAVASPNVGVSAVYDIKKEKKLNTALISCMAQVRKQYKKLPLRTLVSTGTVW